MPRGLMQNVSKLYVKSTASIIRVLLQSKSKTYDVNKVNKWSNKPGSVFLYTCSLGCTPLRWKLSNFLDQSGLRIQLP